MKRVNTNNKGWLETIEPFEMCRGRNKYMGKAKDKEGTMYKIYTAPCGLNCYCWATAKELQVTQKQHEY